MAKQKQIKQEVKIKAREGSRLTDNQAQIFAKHIFSMMKVRSISMVTPEEILQDAKKKSSPYHDWFDWDDAIASEKYRTNQARQLLGSIVEVTITHEEEEPREIRVFVNVTDEEGNRGYVKKEVAIQTPKMWDQVIRQAMVEVTGWKKRYEEYTELAKIHKAITDVENNLGL